MPIGTATGRRVSAICSMMMEHGPVFGTTVVLTVAMLAAMQALRRASKGVGRDMLERRRIALCAGSAGDDLLVQFLIDDLHRVVDLGTGRAELMRDQLHQQIDPFDERRATGDRAGRR